MPITCYQSNWSNWVHPGRQAAQAGKSGPALDSILVVLGMLANAVEVITKNQLELEKAIQKLNAQRH